MLTSRDMHISDIPARVRIFHFRRNLVLYTGCTNDGCQKRPQVIQCHREGTLNARSNLLTRQVTVSMYHDGAPSKSDGEALLHSLSMIARGNCEKDIHKEKKMNNVRHAVGLYMSYPLANDFLAGALKRYAWILKPRDINLHCTFSYTLLTVYTQGKCIESRRDQTNESCQGNRWMVSITASD